MSKKVVVIVQPGQESNMAKFEFLKDVPGAEVSFIDECIIESKTGMLRNHQMETMGPDSFEYTEEYIQALKEANIVVTAMAPIPSAIYENSNVEAVCILRSGVENVDLKKATAAGVKIINAPGRLAVPVSEYTVGLIIAEMKNLARGYARLESGQWGNKFPNSAYSASLKGKNIGIVGCGAVGSRVARVMKAFEANVLIYDPYVKPEVFVEQGYQPVSLEELCKESDVITVHFRLTESTKDMINKEHFAMMKPTAFIVNTARAGLINEEALMDALQNKKIGGAALDVFHEEPLPANSPLIGMDNVTITPHLAGTCSNLFEITFDMVATALKKYFTDGEWINVVNK
jgi:D-3-phosphoglycerate dehydrogenase